MKRKRIDSIRWIVTQRAWFIPHEPLLAKALGVWGYFTHDILVAQNAADTLELRGYAIDMRAR